MKLISIFLLAGALVSASPITVATTAQISLVNAGSPLADDGKYYVGPYTISINGQNVAAMCVDVMDESKIGDTWTAALTQVGGDLSSTYHPDDAVQYKEEAYLYSLITQPGADRVDIQHAAWFITDSAYVIDAAAQAYVTQAQNNYAGMNFSGFELVSSTNTPHEQEFMVSSTPEPASVALLGAGLLLAGLVGRKKFVKS
jgi:hypothetical protein